MIVVPIAKPLLDETGALAGKGAILATAAARMGGLVEVHVLADTDEAAAAAEEFTADRLSTVVHRGSWDDFVDALLDACSRAKDSGAKHLPWIILSGALPDGVPDDAWAPLIPRFREAGVRVAVDLKGKTLMATIGQGGPDLIRVDGSHAGTLLGKKVLTDDDAVWAAGMLDVGLGGRSVVVTGNFGVVLCNGDGTINTRVPDKPIETDALTAALTMTLTGGVDPSMALMLAIGAAQR